MLGHGAWGLGPGAWVPEPEVAGMVHGASGQNQVDPCKRHPVGEAQPRPAELAASPEGEGGGEGEEEGIGEAEPEGEEGCE